MSALPAVVVVVRRFRPVSPRVVRIMAWSAVPARVTILTPIIVLVVGGVIGERVSHLLAIGITVILVVKVII